MELNLVQFYSIVVRYISHLPQSAIFSNKVFNFCRQVIYFVQQFSYFFVFLVLFCPQDINSLHRVTSINVTGVKSKIFI